MSETYEYSDTGEYENVEWPGEFTESGYPEYAESPYAEARRTPPPVRTPTRQSVYKPRQPAPTGYVTEARLQAVVGRLDAKVTVAANAIKTIDGRVRNVMTEQGKQAAALRKEIADRKKDADRLRADLKSTRELGALIGLVAAPAGSSTIARLAPLILLLPPDTLSGYSSGSSSSGGVLGGDNNLVGLLLVGAIAAGAFK